MNIKFCLPIINFQKGQVLSLIQENDTEYQLFEVWIDYVQDFDLEFIKDLSKLLQERLIIVFRRKNLEKIQMPFQQRKAILDIAIKNNCYLDLDISSQKEDLDYVKALNGNVIASFHDYQTTPRTSGLVKIIKDMEEYNPKIYKLATFCKTEKQAISLLHLLLDLREQKKKAVILGMGTLGQITRIYGALWGNEITFAPQLESEASAPGQLTLQQLKNIFAIVNK